MEFCVLFGARLDISFGFISIEQKIMMFWCWWWLIEVSIIGFQPICYNPNECVGTFGI
jgi:hypothetical protein